MSSSENIYTKINKIRLELSKANFKKSGYNKFANFDYFELMDFMPKIIELQDKYGVCSFVRFALEQATLTIVNCDAPDEIVEFIAPCTELEIKGANKIQALGGVQTYMRRYLYMAAYEITEPDTFDAQTEKDDGKASKNKQPQKVKSTQSNPAPAQNNTADERNKLKNELWAKIKLVSELQGKDPKEMLTSLSKQYGKEMQNFTNEEFKKAISVIDLILQNSKTDMNKI